MYSVDDPLRGHQWDATGRQAFGHLPIYISPEIPISCSGENIGCAVTCVYYCNTP